MTDSQRTNASPTDDNDVEHLFGIGGNDPEENDRGDSSSRRVPSAMASVGDDILRVEYVEAIGSARDILITGTAVRSAVPQVLTRNVNEFARIEDLNVEIYWS